MSSNPYQGTRLDQETFVAVQFTFLGLAIVSVGIKIGLRLKTSSSLALDDVLLILSVVLLAAATAVFYRALDLVYTLFGRTTTFNPDGMLSFSRFVNASAVLTWATIYTVKIAFVWFFRRLVDRLPKMKLYWTLVFAIVLACTPVAVFITFYICNDFSLGLQSCGPGIEYRTSVYLHLTAALDIITDVLIISIPVALMWRVKINLKRKIGIATVLCLSTFMVIIEIIRVSLAYIPVPPEAGEAQGRPNSLADPTLARSPTEQIDRSWMFFWLNMEGAVAIMMVSFTAFRSMLGTQSANSLKYDPRGSKSNNGTSSINRSDPLSGSGTTKSRAIVDGDIYESMLSFNRGPSTEMVHALPDPTKASITRPSGNPAERDWFRSNYGDGGKF